MKTHTPWRLLALAVMILYGARPVLAQESAIAGELAAKGAKLTQTGGAVTGLELADLSRCDSGDFKKIAQLTHLQKLSFGKGLNGQQFAILTALPEVTAFVTNGADLGDEDVKLFARFTKLQSLTFFHPGKGFAGPGLGELAGLADLENLTVAGSSAFGNEGMAAIARLPHLKSLRVFHTNADGQGVALLKGMSGLTSITLGQRLSNKPPTMLADDTIGVLASMKSLESVSLSESRLSLDALSQLKQLTSLKRLTLDNLDIAEADIDKLRKVLPAVQIKWTAPSPEAGKRISSLFDQK
jgi:hypothetical protein